MACGPGLSTGAIDAMPLEPSVALPREVEPSAKVTVPVAPVPELNLTEATRVTAFPAMAGTGVPVRVVVVGVWLTVKVSGEYVPGAEFKSPEYAAVME